MISRIYNYFKLYAHYTFYAVVSLIFLIILFYSRTPEPQIQSILMVLFPSILAALLGIIFGIGLPNMRNASIFWPSSQYQFLHSFTFRIIWVFIIGIILPPLCLGYLPFSDIRIQEVLYKANFSIFFVCIMILTPYIRVMFFLQDPLCLISDIQKRISILIDLNKDVSYINKHIENIIPIIREMVGNRQRFMQGLDSIKKDNDIIGYIVRNFIFIEEITSIGYVSEDYSSKKTVIDFFSDLIYIYDSKDKENIKKCIKGITKIGSSNPEFNCDILILETQENLKNVYNRCLDKELNEFDYTVFVYSLQELCYKSFKNDIREGVEECITTLFQIVMSFKDKQLSINPITMAIENIKDIGNNCAEKRWENLYFKSLITLLQLKSELPGEYHDTILFCSLIMASFCNKYIPEALPRVEEILNEQIGDFKKIGESALKYARWYSPTQYSVLKDYLETLDET